MALGMDIEIVDDFNVIAYREPTGHVVVTELQVDADLIVIQRPLAQSVHEIAKAAKRQGIALAADMDDDFHNVHEDNVAFDAVDPTRSPMHNKNWLMQTLKLCDFITVSTPALMKYVTGKTRGAVVRNRVPERIFDIPSSPITGSVGWTGTMTTHPADLARARGVLRLTESDMAIVGDLAGVAKAVGASRDRVHLAYGWADSVDQYWRNVSSAMDVGIAPLEPSKFNKAKSWLKALEYLSLGKPFVASPLPEYRLLVDLSGGGEIAHSSTQWATKVRDMLQDGDRYREAGMDWARQNTLELHIGEWIGAWEKAVQTKCPVTL